MGPKGPFALGKIEQFGEYGFNLKSNSKKTSLCGQCLDIILTSISKFRNEKTQVCSLVLVVN